MDQGKPRNKITEELSEARFQFALKCLQTVVQIKTSENVVFSPYSIYDGLFLLYLASERCNDDIEKYLKRILQLPVNVVKNVIKGFWIIYCAGDRKKENRERDNGYYNVNSCWIKSSFNLNYCLFDRYENFNDTPNLMHHFNEVLRNEIEGHIRQPVEINEFDENMKCIISSILRFKGDIFLPDFLTHVPDTLRWLEKPKETVLSPKLGMFMTELQIIIKTTSLFLLFPAVQSCIPNSWEIDRNISGLVERLTTKKGADELRKVLDKQDSSTEKLSIGSVIYPDFFELENNLSLEQLLQILSIQLLEPDMASRLNLFYGNLLFCANHRAYFKVTSENVIASAVNIVLENDQGSFKSIEETNYSECKNSFVSLIYERVSRTILFIGIIHKNIELPEVSKRRAQRYFVEHK